MTKSSTLRLRELALLPLPQHVQDKDLYEFSYSYNVWLCMWADFCPLNRRVQGELRRLYHIVVADKVLIQQLNADLCYVYESTVTQQAIDFTSCKFGKVLRQLIQEVLTVHNCTSLLGLMDQLGSILTWFKRLPIFCPVPAEEWKEYKARVTCSISPVDGEVLARVRTLAKSWMKHFVIPDFSECAHGTGSTSNVGKVRADKICATSLPHWRATLLRTYAGETFWDQTEEHDVPSKFQSVPKQLGKNRFICLEPSYLQYAQHNVFGHLRKYASQRKHPLSRFFSLEDQERNRSLCGIAQLNDLATIDLSNASDDVHYETWKEIFQGLPIWRYIVGCRSRDLEFRGDVIQPNYVAPMGSALCFIIESIVFSLIVAVAFQDVRHRPCRGYVDNVTVYGDDIICPADVAEQVLSLLTSLGFTLNRSKSFLDGCYRESCGVEYCDGIAISRVNHPRCVISSRNVTAGRVNMIIDLTNALAAHGFLVARRFLLKDWADKRVFGCREYVKDIVNWEEITLDPEYRNANTYHVGWQCFATRTKLLTSHNMSSGQDYLAWQESQSRPGRTARKERALGYLRAPKTILEALVDLTPEPHRVRAGTATLRLLTVTHPVYGP